MVLLLPTSIFSVLLWLVLPVSTTGNPCCSFPCQNNGVCLTTGPSTYICDCSNLEFYGDYCQHPTLMKRVKTWLRPSSDMLHYLLVEPRLKWLWDFVNYVPLLHDFFMGTIYVIRADIIDSPPLYHSSHEYPTLETVFNLTVYSRILPPVPRECPTPMGVKGPKELPDIDLLIKKFFTRKKFLPDPIGSNVLFTFFAQHFTHMFFKSDFSRGPDAQWGGHGVDVSNIYGGDKETENRLRLFSGGKLKMQIIDGEEYPMTVAETGVKMTYPEYVKDEYQLAVGHPFYGLLPGLLIYSTIWMREHNRVCDILAAAHPEWDDERLFQTARLVILGETIKIVIEEYVQHLSNYNFKLTYSPELLFDRRFQYQNRIAAEFNHLYHWHPLMPNTFNISGQEYAMHDFMFHPEVVFKHGLANVVDSMSRQRAGQMSHHNHGPSTIHVLRWTLQHQRQLKLQSLNNYRKRFNLSPYTSFEELTGEKIMAGELKKLYEDVDAVEFYVGLLVEKRSYRAMFGNSIIEIGGPCSVKGLMANFINSPRYWRPSTFGGDVGFHLVKTATLEKLFCRNIKGKCPLVTFRVPDYDEHEHVETWDGRLGHEEL